MPTADLERQLLNNSDFVVGVDEAGVGSWAGPLVAAGVMFHPKAYESLLMDKVQDSKRLKPQQRKDLINWIYAVAYSVSITVISPELIDLMKMKRAHREAIVKSVKTIRDRFKDKKVAAIIDGEILRSRCELPLGENAMFIDKADSLSVSVAAASILAKVHRDSLMEKYDIEFPGYGFAQNKGYGTALHREALYEIGVSPIHRKSFAPIRAVLRDMEE